MTRLVVGPFNRVEGDLEVKLDITGGSVKSARVVSPLYRGFEGILRGKPPLPLAGQVSARVDTRALIVEERDSHGVPRLPKTG